MIQDLHSHTYYSYCGKDSPEDVVKNAIKNGIELVGISDHYYGIVMNRAGFVYQSDEEKLQMHTNALKRYYEHINLIAEKYKDYIEVWCGLEISTADWGYTLMPDSVDVSMFDYCLIEYIQNENTIVLDVFEYVKRCRCKRTGLAHIDLPNYIASKGLDLELFFNKMKEHNVFWELNVNFDSIHNYREHQYVKDLFENDKLINAIKKSGISLSVGFDGHKLEDYDFQRVVTICNRLEELSLPMIK